MVDNKSTKMSDSQDTTSDEEEQEETTETCRKYQEKITKLPLKVLHENNSEYILHFPSSNYNENGSWTCNHCRNNNDKHLKNIHPKFKRIILVA